MKKIINIYKVFIEIKIFFSVLSLLYGPTITSVYDYWKNCSSDHADFVYIHHSKVMSLLFNMLSRFVFASKEKVP